MYKRKRSILNNNNLLRWIGQKTNPKMNGATRKNMCIVYGKTNTGKMKALTKLLERINLNPVIISDSKCMKTRSMFSNNGFFGMNAYLIDAENMQKIIKPPDSVLSDANFKSPIIYICDDPFVLTKGMPWKDIQNEFYVIQSEKDPNISEFLGYSVAKSDLPSVPDKFFESITPWDVMKELVSRSDLNDKIKAVSVSPKISKKILSVLRNNMTATTYKMDIHHLSKACGVLSDMDKLECDAKKAGVFGDMGDYASCCMIQCANLMQISPNTRLSYKSKFTKDNFKNMSRGDVHGVEGFPCLMQGDNKKCKKRKYSK